MVVSVLRGMFRAAQGNCGTTHAAYFTVRCTLSVASVIRRYNIHDSQAVTSVTQVDVAEGASARIDLAKQRRLPPCNMDPAHLCTVLAATTSPDAAQRHAAEEALKQVPFISHRRSSVCRLLAIACRYILVARRIVSHVISPRWALTLRKTPERWCIGGRCHMTEPSPCTCSFLFVGVIDAVVALHLQHQHIPGQLSNLLRVAVEDSMEAAVRQVAAITFKNLVKSDWLQGVYDGCAIFKGQAMYATTFSPAMLPSRPADEGVPEKLAEADKAMVLENLLEGIVRAPPAVRAQLGECAKYVVYSDYPDKWPNLLPSICAALATQVSQNTGTAFLHACRLGSMTNANVLRRQPGEAALFVTGNACQPDR